MNLKDRFLSSHLKKKSMVSNLKKSNLYFNGHVPQLGSVKRKLNDWYLMFQSPYNSKNFAFCSENSYLVMGREKRRWALMSM